MAGFKPGPDWLPYESDGRKFLLRPNGREAAELLPRGGWAVASPLYIAAEAWPVPREEATWAQPEAAEP